MNTKIITAGNIKGGVGKSMAIAAVIEHTLRLDLNPFVIEGDKGTPDIAARYLDEIGQENIILVPLQRGNAEDVIDRLFDTLDSRSEELNGRPIFINLPAGASATLDRQALDQMAPMLTQLGWDLTHLHLIAQESDAAEEAVSSLKNGLASIATTKIAVPNLSKVLTVEDDESIDQSYWRSSSQRSTWLKSGGLEIPLPAMQKRVVDMVIRIPAPYSKIASGEAGGLTLGSRSAVHRWLNACRPLALSALGLDHIDGEADDDS